MKARKLVMVFALIVAAGGFGASRALAHMQQTYNGVCGQLTGVPGLLQKMHFFALGDCKVAGDGTCQSAASCQYSTPSGIVYGKCSHKVPCSCVPN